MTVDVNDGGYFPPGSIINMRDTGELAQVTGFEGGVPVVRTRRHHTDPWGPGVRMKATGSARLVDGEWTIGEIE